MKSKNTKGAMEMSVGTIVTIVLLMSVLVLGIFFISKIFSGANTAVDSTNQQLTAQINKLFSNGKASKITIFPSSQQINIKKGDATPKGFYFSIYNNDVNPADFTYTVNSTDISGCGSTMTNQIADSYIHAGKTDSFSLSPGSALDLAELVLFTVPDSAPPCTVTYKVNVDWKTQGALSYQTYTSAPVYVTFQN